VLDSKNTIREVTEWLAGHSGHNNYFIATGEDGTYAGILKVADLYAANADGGSSLKPVVSPTRIFIRNNDTLRTAAEQMARHDCEALPVISTKGNKIVGIITSQDILTAYKLNLEENETANTQISLRRRRMKMLIRGRKLIRINDVSK